MAWHNSANRSQRQVNCDLLSDMDKYTYFRHINPGSRFDIRANSGMGAFTYDVS